MGETMRRVGRMRRRRRWRRWRRRRGGRREMQEVVAGSCEVGFSEMVR
jgi:hypothetical protein